MVKRTKGPKPMPSVVREMNERLQRDIMVMIALNSLLRFEARRRYRWVRLVMPFAALGFGPARRAVEGQMHINNQCAMLAQAAQSLYARMPKPAPPTDVPTDAPPEAQ